MPVNEQTDDQSGDPNGRTYFRSFAAEMNALKDRVQHFIKDNHWQSVGLWRESILRSILRRHLPVTIGIGTGFVVTEKTVSTQIDILLYDRTKPILFQDGDSVIVTPDVVLGLIEVKTTVENSTPAFQDMLRKLVANVELVRTTTLKSCEIPRHQFFGLFSYKSEIADGPRVLSILKDAVGGKDQRVINALSLGESTFVRFWRFFPEQHNTIADFWRSYGIDGLAPAYFIHNVIEHLCPASVLSNNGVWYSGTDKGPFQTGEIKVR